MRCVLVLVLACAVLGAGCGRPGGAAAPPRVVVSLLQGNALFAIDPATNDLVGSPVALPEGPAGMASRGALVYVALLGRPYVEVLALPGLSEVERLPVGAGCADVALSPAGDLLAAALPTTGEVALVPLAGGEPRRVAVGGSPHAVAWSPDGQALYVTNPGKGALQRLGVTGKVEVEIPVGLGPRGLVVGPEQALVALFDENAVVAVSGAEAPEVRRFAVGGGPYDLLPTGGGAVVSLAEDGALAALDLATGHSTSLPVGAGAAGLAASPDGQFVYVACEAAGEVAVVGLHDSTLVARIPLPPGARPRECVFVPGGSPPAP